MNIEVKHKYVTVNNINLHYVTAGSPEGQTILLIHGFPDFSSWLVLTPPVRGTRIGRLAIPATLPSVLDVAAV